MRVKDCLIHCYIPGIESDREWAFKQCLNVKAKIPNKEGILDSEAT